MKVSDIVRFSKERCFNGAVQTEWFYDAKRVGAVAESYVFHGPKYFGVSETDVDLSGHRLIDTASFALNLSEKLCSERPSNTFLMTIAGYGAGKSHLAVSLAALFSNTDKLSQSVIDNILVADQAIGQRIKQTHKKKNLVVVLNGMNNFNLDAEVLRCVRLALKQNNVSDSALQSLTKSYDIAKYFVERNFDLAQTCFEEEASKLGISLRGERLKKYLIENTEADAKIISCINSVYKEFNGDSIQWDRGLAAGDVLTVVCNELCGQGKPFNKILILFDEFGRYIEYAAAYPEIAGEAALQQIFESVQTASGKMIFAGFVQSELDAYLARIDKSSNIIRYVGRYKSSENLFLSSNFETILANVLQKVDERQHSRVLGNAFERYKLFHNRMENSLVRWDRTQNKKSVWTDASLYDSVILRGCYPLHPYTVWLLSNMNRWMQQRSAIAFAAEMVERIADMEIEGAWLPYVYPVNIIDSSIYDEMLNSEEKGLVQSQYCMLYRDIILKIGDKLTANELTVLKAVLIINIARFAFTNKDDALTAIKYCSNLKEDEIALALKDLENLHGVVSFDENANKFDLIAEANGLNEFKRVYSKYRIMTKSAAIGDLDESLRKELSLNTDIETGFGQDHHISSLEWRFKKSLYDSTEITRELIASKLRAIENNYAGEESRGELIFAYCADDAAAEISRLSALHRGLALDNCPIIIVFLDDSEGEILAALTLKKVLNRFSNSDRERFEKHIVGQQKMQDKKIIRKFTALVQKRDMVTNTGLGQYQGRLNALCSGRFNSVFTRPAPFMFDGFENKTPAAARRYLANICTKMFDRTLMNVHSYNALTSDEKNRVKAVLAVGPTTSWQVYNNSCSFIKPLNPVLAEIFNDIDQTVEQSKDPISVLQLLGKYAKKPYGMNINSLALFAFYYIAYKDKQVLCYYGQEKLLPVHVGDKIFKKQKLDPKEFIKLSVQKNVFANRDLVQELCHEIMSCTAVEQCANYRNKLDLLIAQEGISDENQLAVAAAAARLDEGLALRDLSYDKIAKANEIISEAKKTFSLQKFCRIFNYYVDTSTSIAPNLPFVYSDYYKGQLSEIKAATDAILKNRGFDAIKRLSCKITQLSQFKNICTNIENRLREHGYSDLATALEARAVAVEEDLLARQKYETTLVELDKDIAMISDVNSIGYAECISYIEKLNGWRRFFDATKDMPPSLAEGQMQKITATLSHLRKRQTELTDVCKTTIAQIAKNDSVEAMGVFYDKIKSLIEVGLNEEDCVSATIVLKEIQNATKAIDNLPNKLTSLQDFLKILPEDLYGNCQYVVSSEVKRRIDRLLTQQKHWVERFIAPIETSITGMSAFECTNWMEKTKDLPDYLEDETIARYNNLLNQVETRMHKSRVDGVLAMYSKLTDSEKVEVQKAIMQKE